MIITESADYTNHFTRFRKKLRDHGLKFSLLENVFIKGRCIECDTLSYHLKEETNGLDECSCHACGSILKRTHIHNETKCTLDLIAKV